MIKTASLLKKLLPLSIVVLSTTALGSEPARVTGRIETGFDSFMEKYSIVEQDTLDKITEFRSGFSLDYQRGKRLRDYFRIEGRALAGNNTVEGDGRLSLAVSLGSVRLGAELNGSVRTFRSNSNYAFPNDYARYNLRTYLKKELTPTLSVRLSERMELLDFDQSTEFDHDYVKNNISISGDMEHSYSTLSHLSVGYITKSIPDTTEISYKSYFSQFDFQHQLGIYRHLSLSLSAERRNYAHKPNKSPFWSILSDLAVVPLEYGEVTLAMENTLEYYHYDTNSEVYFSYIENKSFLLLGYQPSFNFQVRSGPVYGFFTTDLSAEEQYQEIGGKLSFEFYHGTGLWFSLAYEPGRRCYNTFSEEESIYSDYTYHRLTCFASTRFWDRFSLTSFLDFEPEQHERKGDDSTITLFSMNLAYTF